MDLPTLRALTTELIQKVDGLRQELARLEGQREEIRDDLSKLSTAQEHAVRLLEETQRQHRELLATLASTREEIRIAQQQVAEFREQALAARREHDAALERLAALKRQIIGIEADRDERERRRLAVAQELERLEQQRDRLRQAREDSDPQPTARTSGQQPNRRQSPSRAAGNVIDGYRVAYTWTDSSGQVYATLEGAVAGPGTWRSVPVDGPIDGVPHQQLTRSGFITP